MGFKPNAKLAPKNTGSPKGDGKIRKDMASPKRDGRLIAKLRKNTTSPKKDGKLGKNTSGPKMGGKLIAKLIKNIDSPKMGGKAARNGMQLASPAKLKQVALTQPINGMPFANSTISAA